MPARSRVELDCLSKAEAIIAARARRKRFLRPDLFYEPQWDMLLDLYVRTLRGKAVSVSSLTIASNVAPTSALRHIAAMEFAGEVVRRRDPKDGRRTFLELSPATRDAISRWLEGC